MKPTLHLPNRNGNGEREILQLETNLVIVGANGAGKTRLGSWIETTLQAAVPVHRVSAQKALNIPDYVPVKTLEQAEKNLFFGREDQHATVQNKAASRWGQAPATYLLNDYDHVLSTLFARAAMRDREYTSHARVSGVYSKVPNSALDIISEIWKDILPHREIIFEDGKVMAKRGNGAPYHGKGMSDGERVALYLIGQCLSAPDHSIVVIDEPEIHLHKALMARLWDQIEEKCPNKLLVFITHDLDFAASRTNDKKLWIKDYDGAGQWTWEEVPEIDEIPEALTIEILGSRKSILFTEGERSGYDFSLYRAAYPEFHVIPRGGCRQVIESTRALRENESLHHVISYGIIDSDYRAEEEIESLLQNGIHPIDVAEIENLFCIEPLLRIVAGHLELDPEHVVNQVTDFIVDEMKKELEVQVTQRTQRQIHLRLTSHLSKSNTQHDLIESYKALLQRIDISAMYAENKRLYLGAIQDKNLAKALSLYNRKSFSRRISRFFKLADNGYLELILRLLKSERKGELISAFQQVLPILP